MSRNIATRRVARRRTAEDRRQAALEATLGLLSRVDYDRLSVEDIAAAAGMSRPLLYHYFGGGKEQVVAAALRWCGESLLANVFDAAMAADQDWLPAGVHAYVSSVADTQAWYATLMRHAYLPGTAMDSMRKEVRLRIFHGLHHHLAPHGGSPVLRLLIWGWVGQVERMSREWLSTREPAQEVLESILCELLPATLRTAANFDSETESALRSLTVDITTDITTDKTIGE